MVGSWLKWVVGRGSAKLHTASLSSLIVDRRAGMKWVVGRGSAAEVGGWSLVVVGLWSWLGRGWVVAEVDSVMIFFEWVCSSGFQIGGVDF